MKTFNRASLPESIIYNGKVYKCDVKASASIMGGLGVVGLSTKSVIRVNVLSKELKGKTDLYGQPYKPTTWLFVGGGY